jgi:hypothetical protein
MVVIAQFVTMQGQLGGNVPEFFRSFASSFAWMSGFGSSLVDDFFFRFHELALTNCL